MEFKVYSRALKTKVNPLKLRDLVGCVQTDIGAYFLGLLSDQVPGMESWTHLDFLLFSPVCSVSFYLTRFWFCVFKLLSLSLWSFFVEVITHVALFLNVQVILFLRTTYNLVFHVHLSSVDFNLFPQSTQQSGN